MKTFSLIREGVKVLEGAVFSDASCVVRWRKDDLPNCTALWDSFDAFSLIHADERPGKLRGDSEVTWNTGEIRTFELHRTADEHGRSGTGKVLEGVVFSDGVCAIRWEVAKTPDSTSVWQSFEGFKQIHVDAHPTNGTTIHWHNETPRN